MSMMDMSLIIGDLARLVHARVIARVQRPLGRAEQHAAARVFQGTAMVSAVLAGSAVWCTLRQWRQLESVAALRQLCADSCEAWFRRLLIAPLVQRVIIADPALRELPTSFFYFIDLRVLDLSGSALAILPPQVSRLRRLATLKLARCQLAVLPPQIGALRSLLELDLSGNLLSALPPELGTLTQLKYLNVMSNQLVALPSSIGGLHKLLRLGLKGNMLRELPDSIGGLTSLVELFITDNQLERLPAAMGQLTSLVKLQASFNALTELPPEMGSLPRLELMRVAVNRITQLPASFAGLDALAWMSLGGNPVCRAAVPARSAIVEVGMAELELGAKLGDGASGDVFAATLRGLPVALKVFKADASPDGRAADEIAVTCAVDHPSLIKVVGIVRDPHALVVIRVEGTSMAEKPNLLSLLRCRWPPNLELALSYVLRAATDVASALAYLHRVGICHGDVYAHNVLADAVGRAVLCDYGASFFYQRGPVPYEAQEVRAFGLFLADLVARVPHQSRPAFGEPSAQHRGRAALAVLAADCTGGRATERLAFARVHSRLLLLTEQCRQK